MNIRSRLTRLVPVLSLCPRCQEREQLTQLSDEEAKARLALLESRFLVSRGAVALAEVIRRAGGDEFARDVGRELLRSGEEVLARSPCNAKLERPS